MIRLGLSSIQRKLLATITCELPPLGKDGPWVAGGSIRNIAVDKSLDNLHDIDCFSRDAVQAAEFELALLAKGFKDEEYSTEKCHTLCKGHGLTAVSSSIGAMCAQIILGRFHANMQSVVDSFSITACQFITDGVDIYAYEAAIADAEDRRFVLVNEQRLSPSFVKKYLRSYGYIYLGSQEELQSRVDEALKGFSGDAPAGAAA